MTELMGATCPGSRYGIVDMSWYHLPNNVMNEGSCSKSAYNACER